MTTEKMIEIFLDKGAWAYKLLNKNTPEGRRLYTHQPVEIEGHVFTCYREYSAFKMGNFLKENLPEAEVVVTLDSNNSTIEITVSDEEQRKINQKMYSLLKQWNFV